MLGESVSGMLTHLGVEKDSGRPFSKSRRNRSRLVRERTSQKPPL